jgi:hypothetical protein
LSTAAAALPPRPGASRELVFRFKAPLLDRLLSEQEDPERRLVALDLGPPCQALLDRISESRPCRVEIADFVRSDGIRRLTESESLEEEGEALLDSLLPSPNMERLDAIFLWDLPNYLSLPALRLIIDVLARRAAPGCKLHMLIAYSRREMAELPPRYVPDTEGNLTQFLATDAMTQAPRYSPEDLGAAAGGFRYERGILLANGMQEFVYAWPSQTDARRPF